MSKTLFWYIFWQLLRVFAMATVTLAAIMTFAGMMRPLTEHGLEIRQVNRMLLYMLPAMSTYSLPVASLFAATFVYGRFSADNELTAMRAGGIGYLSCRRFSIALPALLLGLLVAMIGLVMLCFIVPAFSYRVQDIIYSNIAKAIANDIEREHEVDFPGFSSEVYVYADSAKLLPEDRSHPLLQQVDLFAPAIVTFANVDTDTGVARVPREFWMARSARVMITRSGISSPMGDVPVATFRVQTTDGIKFPREFFGNVQAGVADTSFGPREIPSPIHENVKFLDVRRLASLAADPAKGERVQSVLRDVIRRQQQLTCLESIANPINRGDDAGYRFPTDPGDDAYEIGGKGAAAEVRGGELIISAPVHGDQTRGVWMKQTHGSQQTLAAAAREIHVRVAPDPVQPQVNDTAMDTPADSSPNAADQMESPGPPRVTVSIELYDTELQTQDGVSERLSFIRNFSEPMPDAVRKIAGNTLADFQRDPNVTASDATMLQHEQVVVNNAARSELHGRASFALSCLILVMVGCALGMMFKSGNLLNAFAVSFLPALLSITLIFCGQQAATHVPFDMGPAFHDPLFAGLTFIWAGNLIVLVTAVYLTVRLQRR